MTARPLRLNPGHAVLGLGSILLAAAALRLYGINWDAGQHLHPDERFIVMVDTGIQWPHSLAAYFDSAHSPLNPYNRGFGNFVYGTLPIFLLKLVATLLHRDTYDGALLVGRALSSLADLGSIWLVFLAGRRLYGQAIALLATAFMAFSVMGIQLSHFMAVDTFTVFFLMLTFYYAVRFTQEGGWSPVIGMGLSFGLALACKLSIALAPVLIAGAVVIRLIATWPRPKASVPLMAGGAEVTPGLYVPGLRGLAQLPTSRGRTVDRAWAVPQGSLWYAASVLVVSFVCAGIAFRIFQPYAFEGLLSLSPKWSADEASQQAFIAGTADVPFLLQWAHTTPIVFPLKDIVLYGMGWPLGLLGLAGLAVGGYQLLWRARWVHLLPAAWIVTNLLYLGLQQSKTMRYFYQLYPFLALMAASLVVTLFQHFRRTGFRVWNHRLNFGLALGVFVLIATGLNAFAFTRIYSRPNTRVAASDWIYQNIPAGSTLAVEHWDDALPLGLAPGETADRYRLQTLTLYDDDNPAKVDMIVQGLTASDYVILSSNRLYGSITRIPQRYPITSDYYKLLFADQLGFQLVHQDASYPTLFGIPLKDDRVMGYQSLAAQLQPDEAFTVYDHPHVLIFQKTADFSATKVRQLLSVVPWQDAQRLTPKQASLPATQLTLSPQDRAADEASGTWSVLFNPASLTNRLPVLTWWLAIELLGVVAFPLIFLALGGLWDGGWLLAKPTALLLLAYLAWLPASLHLAVWGRAELMLAAALILVCSTVAFAWRRATILTFVRANWRRIAIGEGLFAILFAFFMVVRMSNPDLWHPAMGGEKPMDFAFLNATLKSVYFPPYDPWFSGGYINYYYFGFVIVGSLIKLLGIVPQVGYNLAVAILPTFTGIGAFAIVATFVSWKQRSRDFRSLSSGEGEGEGKAGTRRFWVPILAGLLAVVLVVIMGNLGDIPLLMQRLHNQPIRIEWWYWNATREIPDVINELPFFTFLYGDLHAHAIALPYTMLAIGTALALVLSRSLAGLFLLALVLGALKPTNTWDLPTYLVLATAFLIVADWPRWQRALFKAAGVFVLATLLFEPYSQHFATLYSSIQPWTGKRTELGQYLIVHGIFLFIISCYLLNELFGPRGSSPLGRLARLLVRHRARLFTALRRAARAPATPGRRLSLVYWLDGLAMFSLVLLVLALLKLWLPLVLVLLLAMASLALFSSNAPAHKRLTYIFIGLGLSLSLATEFVVLQGDVGRMNTVFKLDFQVWVLWALASALALYDLFTELKPRQEFQRSFAFGAASLLIAAGMTYPLAAGIARAHDRFTQLPLTADGEAYMPVSTWQDQQPIPLQPDYEAITWLQQHIEGSPVILEGRGRLYSWASRVSIYTGLPTVLGWDWHEIQQRGLFGDQEIQRRANDVKNMYTNPSLEAVLPMLRQYQVSYIYVGPFERETYAASGLSKFDALPTVYDNDGVKIYQVPQI